MSLTSMTGYGGGTALMHGWRVEIELSSVNRKQLDVRLNLPRQLTSLESRMYGLVHKVVARGQISVVLRMTTVAGEQDARCAALPARYPGPRHHDVAAGAEDADGVVLRDGNAC